MLSSMPYYFKRNLNVAYKKIGSYIRVMRSFLTKNMFWVVLLITLLLGYYLNFHYVREWNLNRTIGRGWAGSWFLEPDTIWVTVGHWFNFFSVLVYFVLYLKNRKTSFFWSIIHILVILIWCSIIVIPSKMLYIHLAVSAIVLGLNVYFSKAVKD